MEQLIKSLLENNLLCDNCLGRQFALLGYGLTNAKRGQILKNATVLLLYNELTDSSVQTIYQNIAYFKNDLAKKALKKQNIKLRESEGRREVCELCEGLFDRLEEIANEIVDKLANEEYETFLVGAKFYPELVEKEDILRAKHKITTGETIKSEFTREIGKLIMEKTGKEPEFELPDITILIDLPEQTIELQKRSLYIFGRYNKLIRTIPQTRWPCYNCNGEGCEECNFTGKKYQESVEELVAEPILEVVGGTGTKFHGAGREDIDARMLGNGRPFVLEVLDPHRRFIDLEKIEQLVNKRTEGKVQVSNLEIVDKSKVQEIKAQSTDTKKTYRARIRVEKPIPKEKLTELEKVLKGKTIEQRTPTRVEHRRADKIRKRTVYDIQVEQTDDQVLEAIITGEGGLYIKELISGDSGRTKPSFSEILETSVECYQLDVINVHKPDA
ncbi:tRNA pseudouridine(54/55) synthase Pus10 [Candidatus Heimdallarchaeota archaeon]|jgi:tRNA pseudouridine synthase 10|nr:MAG: tRNA pseudouridine(54/55) synthase Pus10 [Candidatus Heimdallarchaeota archaeon]